MGYAISLLVCALVARNRGHPAIWSSTVRDTRFLARPDQQRHHKAGMEIPVVATQQTYYYPSDPSLKMQTSTVGPNISVPMHVQSARQ